jgi:surfeit locus 1 family protein
VIRRLPLIPTLIVALAVAAMIALGLWQLRRAEWKEALIARYSVAARQPAVAFPLVPIDDSLLFRRSSAFCLQPVDHVVESGRSRAGASGWRHLVSCRRGAEGPGIMIDVGWSRDFATKPNWRGGQVAGIIGPRPDHRSLIASLTGNAAPPGILLVALSPAPGLAPSALPSPADVPNNHRGYAVQWFLFAAVAAIIYAIAVRRRLRRPAAPPSE